MLAAALIPFIFIFALLVMFMLGAWDVGAFTGLVSAALLLFIAGVLARITYQVDAPKPAK